jgi:putative DNA primase/helicase
MHNDSNADAVRAFATLLEAEPARMPLLMERVKRFAAPAFKRANVPFTLSKDTASGEAVATCYAKIDPKLTEWAVARRIPRAALTLIVGTEGLGKTAYELDLAARATRGELTGVFRGQPVNVALLTPEDDPSRTVRPRLDAAGADAARVFDVKMRKDKFDAGVSLPDDTAAIAQTLIDHDIRIMFSDPLAAMLDPKRNSWKDTDVRSALEPLIAVCAEHDITWIGTLHTNKTNSTDARQRGMGTVGWRQIARASFLIGLDPDDPTGDQGSSRCIAHDKHNLGPWTPTQRFKLDSVDLRIDGVAQSMVRAVLGEECEVTKGEMLAAEQGFENLSDRKAEDALKWLRRQLEGGPRAVKAVGHAAEQAGHKWRTIERAKKELGVQSTQGPNGWTWELVDSGGLPI